MYQRMRNFENEETDREITYTSCVYVLPIKSSQQEKSAFTSAFTSRDASITVKTPLIMALFLWSQYERIASFKLQRPNSV